jgi:monofunctional biosynthetic peptidoglycan transglycosylase
MRVAFRRGDATPRGWLRRVVRALLLVAFAPVPFILLFAVVNPPVTMVMLQRAGQRFLAGDKPAWPVHTPVSRSAMSPLLRRAVLASEDGRFYLHNGIDFIELNKAIEQRKRGGKLRGASTVTQQVAKNIFLWNGRSFVRKGIEAYITLWLELLLTKERILDLYINLAEWGPYHFGAEAGARYHYRKSAASLTREESARMAAILPAPRRWTPRGSVASRRVGAVLQRMRYAAPKTEAPK